MIFDDHWQVGTAVARLRRAAEMVNPANPLANPLAEILPVLAEVTAMLREPLGDPGVVDAQAAAFHALAVELAAASTEAGQVASGPVPQVWEGQAADAAIAALKATRDLMEHACAAMRDAGDLLDEHTETLRRLEKELQRHRDQLAVVRRELDGVLGAARHFLGGHLMVLVAKAFLAIQGCAAVLERWSEAGDRLRRGLREVEVRARAGAIRSGHVTAFDAVRLAEAGDGGILTTAQLRRAADRFDALSTQDRTRMRELLDAAAGDAEKAYLLKALAAGHPLGAIDRFAALIHGRSEEWLRTQLSLIDPAGTGIVDYEDRIIQQRDASTCGPTAIMLARAMNDPVYALSLTTDERGHRLDGDAFHERIQAEESRIHDSANGAWPQRLGTTPWGLTAELNRHGMRYEWHAADGTALDAAVGAVDSGHTVPVLIGDGYPRHYVLMIGHEGGDLVFYNPLGEVVRVSEADFRDGNTSALGYRHAQAVVTPA